MSSPSLRRIVGAAVALALSGFPARAEPADLYQREIVRFGAFDAADRLAFRGGLVLRGPKAFGGLSGLLVNDARFLAATDTGHFVTGRMVLDGKRLTGVDDVSITARRDLAGEAITSKAPADAEALAQLDGKVVVLVEQAGQLLSYAADGLAVVDAAPDAMPVPAPVRKAGRRGLESLASLPDGSLIVIAEKGARGADTIPAFHLPSGKAFAIRAHGDFAITGADALPGGDLMLVERRYGGGIDVGMQVRRIGADAVAREGVADGPVLLKAGFSAEIDNMEAIAARVDDGEIILTLASDDNHKFYQRSLLLRFAVADPLPRPNPRRG
ncbi:esterase-like activity of phytase family protein [Acuticoccus sp. MNP-M23]|uniref:esterase-like activity of phytase family protein n=1 Tax=Acuticoccus sp. MNP-M23 TaxID=3072793 RepID=UPI00281564B3|nr:esterase-like activity of phytase family protein [Acuticoccus sp. MNP-M23]WMS43639.1 esterase-like activity of phytase family protein [Acuticoccus sp. MNP-M23]